MDALFSAAADNWFWTVIGMIAIVWTVASSVEGVVRTASRERSRREIAAYIAAGTMTPEQGERLMNAGRKSPRVCE